MSLTETGNSKRREVIEGRTRITTFPSEISSLQEKPFTSDSAVLWVLLSQSKEVPSTELLAVGLAAGFENVMCLCCFRD